MSTTQMLVKMFVSKESCFPVHFVIPDKHCNLDEVIG